MDKDILEEIIADYERMLGIITHRLNQLKALKNKKIALNTAPNRGVNYSVGDEVAEKRRQAMKEVEKMKIEAKEKAKKIQEETQKRLAEVKASPKFPHVDLPMLPILGTQNDEDKKDG